MTTEAGGRWFGKLLAPAAGAAALAILALPNPAMAQPYPGWDFGGGVGIGIGPPPSAYNPCPNYGWPYYPHPCAYRSIRRAHHHAHRITQ